MCSLPAYFIKSQKNRHFSQEGKRSNLISHTSITKYRHFDGGAGWGGVGGISFPVPWWIFKGALSRVQLARKLSLTKLPCPGLRIWNVEHIYPDWFWQADGTIPRQTIPGSRNGKDDGKGGQRDRGKPVIKPSTQGLLRNGSPGIQKLKRRE